MSKAQWGHGFHTGFEEAIKLHGPVKRRGDKTFEAIKDGACDAITDAMFRASGAPGLDVFEEIRSGAKDAMNEFISKNEEKIIQAIAEIVAKRF